MTAIVPGSEGVSGPVRSGHGRVVDAKAAPSTRLSIHRLDVAGSISTPLRHVVLGLLSVVVFLGIMHFFPEQWSGTIHDRFNLDREANIPSWFSSTLLFSVALTALANYLMEHNVRDDAKFWLIFSGVYTFLSVDEAARLHEIFDNSFSIKWIFVYAPFAAIFFTYCAYRIYRQESATVWNWIIAGLGVYALGGLAGELVDYLTGHSELEILLEEVLEMTGTIAVLTGCLHKLTCRLS